VNGHINEHRHEVQCRVAERDLGGECESGGHCCAPTSSANSSSMDFHVIEALLTRVHFECPCVLNDMPPLSNEAGDGLGGVIRAPAI
jgi:hypothetical protein